MKYDLSIDNRFYLPVRTEPDDFDTFWKETLLTRVASLNAIHQPADYLYY